MEIFRFGSFELMTEFPDSDIDLVCVFTQKFNKDDTFFKLFPKYLKEKQKENIESIQLIKDCFIPLIKLKYKGVKFDLVFAQAYIINELNQSFVPQNLVQLLTNNEENNRNLNKVIIDRKSQIIMNGPKNAFLIKKYIGEQDYQKFVKCLKIVKFWAKQKGIYSNIFGYLGGIHYAIMVAKLCLQFRYLNAFETLDKFFMYYYSWKVEDPISLQEQEIQISQINNSKSLMIYGPSDSSQNIASSFSESSYNIFKKSLRRASLQIKSIHKKVSIQPLVKEFQFYQDYNYFLQIQISSKKNDDQFKEIKGAILSKIKNLTFLLENQQQLEIRFWPIPLYYQQEEKYSQFYYYGLRLELNQMICFKPIIFQFINENLLEHLHQNSNLSINLINGFQLQKNSRQQDIRLDELQIDKTQSQFNSDNIKLMQLEIMRINGILFNCQDQQQLLLNQTFLLNQQ